MIRVVTDSTASIPHDVLEALDIEVVSMYLHWNGVEYEDRTMDVDKFYKRIYDMVDNIPTSSQPSQGDLEALFEEVASGGDDLIGIFMSSDMSGTVNGAFNAAKQVASRYAGFNFRIIDSLSNSMDEGWSVLEAAKARNEGHTLDECCARACDAVAASRFLFVPESLRFLRAGGRIGNVSSLLGTLMKILPVVTVTDGKTTMFDKVRTHKKALGRIAQQFKSDIESYGLKNVVVHYIGSAEPAIEWCKENIEPACGRKVRVIPVSPVIGLHVGPAIAVTYECEKPLPRKLSQGVQVPIYSS